MQQGNLRSLESSEEHQGVISCFKGRDSSAVTRSQAMFVWERVLYLEINSLTHFKHVN